jgi:hypothetical protein
MQATRPIILTICLCSLFTLTGCQQTRPVDLGPQLDADGYRRSLALDTPLLYYIHTQQAASASTPWYANRNDLTPAASAGYALPTFQSSVTITRDRQHNSSGQVRDHYSNTTYSREYRRAVR